MDSCVLKVTQKWIEHKDLGSGPQPHTLTTQLIYAWKGKQGERRRREGIIYPLIASLSPSSVRLPSSDSYCPQLKSVRSEAHPPFPLQVKFLINFQDGKQQNWVTNQSRMSRKALWIIEFPTIYWTGETLQHESRSCALRRKQGSHEQRDWGRLLNAFSYPCWTICTLSKFRNAGKYVG